MVLAAPRVALPNSAGLFKEQPAESEWIESFVQCISTELNSRTRDDAARPSVLLQSPNGSVFALFVDDAGTVSATKV